MPANLPVNDILSELSATLLAHNEVVLQAPPGAGKTTVVPLSLLQQVWLQDRKILLLEPRRMAARAAAARMAQLLGEEVGQTVGYSIRLDSAVSAQTRIEVITEGILTRRLQADPGLEDVGLVIFDEFHERSLDSDLCLALCLQGREIFREGPSLKLLVMSATLDGDAVSALLGDAPVVTSEGRQYPVSTYFGRTHRLQDPLAPAVVSAVQAALRKQDGSVLVFLPGQREINAVGRELAGALERSGDDSVVLAPLYGGLSMDKQQRAIAPAPAGQRKVVLATNVAETSLTIEGISAVVDSGLVREALFDPSTGMTRLTTRRISQASAEQRRGRAGRLGPGHCYRLWSEEQHGRLSARATPEILHADLAPLAMQILSWGVRDPAELPWLDPPPAAAWQQALAILEQCGALYINQGVPTLTPHGVKLAQMPLHPRLAHMLLVACDIHASETASLLAAVLSERHPLRDAGADLSQVIAVLMAEQPCPDRAQGWFRRTWQLARRYARIAGEVHKPRQFAMAVAKEDVMGVLLASAYPDRVARRRAGSDTDYQLANGRTASILPEDALCRQAWLAVADTGGESGSRADRIFNATALNPACFEGILSSLVREEQRVEWDGRQERFTAQRQKLVGCIEIASEPMSEVSAQDRSMALLGVVRRKGLDMLPWNESLNQWRSRVQLMRRINDSNADNPWPDLGDDHLLETLDTWLLPYLDDVSKLEDFRKLDLKQILHAQLPWPLPLELERLAPERLSVPSGSSVTVDYSQDPPVLAVKLQEMFGCEDTPTIAGGRIPLQVHLLSPARRPVQVTQDLAGFWRSSYQEVRKEMRGRYPKHPWPDDPLAARATAQTKRHAPAVSG